MHSPRLAGPAVWWCCCAQARGGSRRARARRGACVHPFSGPCAAAATQACLPRACLFLTPCITLTWAPPCCPAAPSAAARRLHALCQRAAGQAAPLRRAAAHLLPRADQRNTGCVVHVLACVRGSPRGRGLACARSVLPSASRRSAAAACARLPDGRSCCALRRAAAPQGPATPGLTMPPSCPSSSSFVEGGVPGSTAPPPLLRLLGTLCGACWACCLAQHACSNGCCPRPTS